MKGENERIDDVKRLLRSSFLPMDTQLPRDLWPGMLKRMTAAPIALPWYDWALIALFAAWLLAVPQSILQLLYQF
ncbi:MAG TPA: hypothetical protein VL156_07050 [Terriglobales bacterium]|jgi:hypothetical protein|nr:hypothetical protein [Terriglobales bacterium]